jgi:hypothetical protein
VRKCQLIVGPIQSGGIKWMSEVDPLLTINQTLNQKDKIKNNDSFHEAKLTHWLTRKN